MATDAKIALLRAVNVGGRQVPMATLRSLCADLGWVDARTYIQSGNVVFRSGAPTHSLEAQLEKALEATFRIRIPTMVRTLTDWRRYVLDNPFAAEAEADPARVHLAIAKAEAKGGAAGAIESRGAAGERVAVVRDAVYIHYPAGAGRSKLTPTLIDRAVGAPVTARNWRTTLKLEEMAGALDGG